MEKGWDAEGLLRPLWLRYSGRDGKLTKGRRDALAAAVGTTGSALSAVNSGNRPLGPNLAGRLAAELGVSLAELGAPEEAAGDPASIPVLDRLRAVEEAQERLESDLRQGLSALREAIDRIASERSHGSTTRRASRPRRGRGAQE